MPKPIITSFLDTDLYKFTMMQCVYHQFPKATARYRFNCRKKIDLTPFKSAIEEQVASLANLSWQPDELAYLAGLPFIQPDFIQFLSTFKFDPDYITLSTSASKLELVIEGPWLQTILFEVPLLAIISETFYQANYPDATLALGRQKLAEKIEFIQQVNEPGFRFSDFGTRRRYAKAWQQELVQTLCTTFPAQFQGTSNVWCAKQYGVRPIGTMAHEFLQAAQVLAPDLIVSQKYALQTWAQEYPQQLGIALTDVFAMDVFLKDFDRTLANQYEGLRQDSGDPSEWARKAIDHYRKLDIDPMSKRLVFSNGLTFEKALSIYQKFKDETQLFFGIGTNLTNDVGFEPLDIVIKMTHANDKPVIKISDSPGKTICESEKLLHYVKQVFNL